MHIIPVIDLMHGHVVQAVRGQRQHYRPIQSQLTSSHHLIDVVDAILQVYPFDCVYIADLNAITKDTQLADHRALIQRAMQSFPQITWWVDAGICTSQDLQRWQGIGVTPILASEVLGSIESYQQLYQQAPESRLSLDFFSEGFKGPAGLLENSALWSQPTILMSLPKVGAQQGPDLDRLMHMRQHTPKQQFYAAGGVRHMEDIQALAAQGAYGVLIASALHQKQLNSRQITTFQP
ncbi:HisA/HisF-related TIM barrel protein [Methylophilus aquaticus]|uniref:HisA/HisF-related TIM barrel protein n=1 Tax=Methylophilus aquaticus TaxID=1971610 RepID=A0ABT9JRF3_9PROT|nr:HisA/HisF-related TIM barrel protein [Methylophilus aquaticus]MDP8567111.1 HisA/HisF-related TIM barrel protein [Methylophilus aquaticus]